MTTADPVLAITRALTDDKRRTMRISRPCYDKMHRCPGWAGGGTRYAKAPSCNGGSLTGAFEKKLWRWRLNRCRECKVLVLPYMIRWLDWHWYGWLRPRMRNWLADPGHWAGVTTDPAEVASPTAWLFIGSREFYAWPWRIQLMHTGKARGLLRMQARRKN